MNHDHRIPAGALRALVVLSIAGLSACTGATSPAPSVPAPVVAGSPTIAPPPSATATNVATSAEPSDSGLDGATAVPTSIDPCQIITAAEAGQLAGATFGPGKESTTEGNARICTYGSSTLNVFTVEIAIAPDLATAQADEAAALADIDAQAAKLSSHGLTTTTLPGFAPGADAVLFSATIDLGGATIGGSGIYVLHGTTFFGFSDIALHQAPPTPDAVKAEAMTVLGRLP
jgi:hypothetical protein